MPVNSVRTLNAYILIVLNCKIYAVSSNPQIRNEQRVKQIPQSERTAALGDV